MLLSSQTLQFNWSPSKLIGLKRDGHNIIRGNNICTAGHQAPGNKPTTPCLTTCSYSQKDARLLVHDSVSYQAARLPGFQVSTSCTCMSNEGGANHKPKLEYATRTSTAVNHAAAHSQGQNGLICQANKPQLDPHVNPGLCVFIPGIFCS